MKSLYLLFGLLFSSFSLFSQAQLHGKVTMAETNEELIYANIILNKDGVFAYGATTDFDGNYSISVDPGTYDIKVNYTGLIDKQIEGVKISANERVELDIQLEELTFHCHYFISWDYKIPLIKQDDPSSEHTMTSEDIRNQSTKNVKELILNTPGVSISNF